MTQVKARDFSSTREREKHSLSFHLLNIFLVAMLMRFYVPVFFNAENVISRNFTPLLAIGLCAVEILFLIIWNVKISNRALALFLATFMFVSISVLLNSSGAEHAFGLFNILIGIYLFHAEPLQKREQNKVVLLFSVAVALVLLNGSVGDADNAVTGKFNPNACAFLLTMLYCVSIMRLCSKRSFLNIVLAGACFLLQFFYISRTALFGEILFTFCLLVSRAWKSYTFSPRTVFWVILCFSLLGLLLAYVYSEILYPSVGQGEIFIFGKDIFTGRQTVWNFAFESIREHFWFGVGGHLNEAQFESGYNEWIMNAHNQAVGTFAYYGIFSFMLFYIAFAFLAAQPYRKEKADRVNRLPAIFILTVTVMGYFEICFLSSYIWIAILIAYGLIFSNTAVR